MDGTGSASEATSLTTGRHINYEATNETEELENNSQFVIAECHKNTDPDPRPTNATTTNDESSDETENEDLHVLDEIVDRGPEHAVLRALALQAAPRRLLAEAAPRGSFAAAARAAALTAGDRCRLVLLSAKEYSESLALQAAPRRLLAEAAPRGSFAAAARAAALTAGDRCRLVLLSAKEYNLEACRRRAARLSLAHEAAGCAPEERALRLRTLLDFAQTQSVHALGALLAYLDAHWADVAPNARAKPVYMCLRRMSLADLVSMDADTYRGLQVFAPEPHPSGFRRGARGSAREGHSLARMFAHCASSVGRRRMRVLMQHPSWDLALLTRRLDVVEYFMSPHTEHTRRNICSSLRFIKNINGILTKIKALSAKAYQWKSLYNTLYHAVLICELCEAAKGVEYLETIASCDNNKLYEMALYMNRIIDFDLSKSEGKFTVKSGVDPELDRKKQTMSRLGGLMSAAARAELARLPAVARECAMLYMPRLGYVLGVRAWAPALTPADLELPDMKFMFQNNDYIHYKTRGCEELDALIGDAYPEIVAHETRIMLQLTAKLLQHLPALQAVVDLCADLDCLITMSKVSKEHGFVRPALSRARGLRVRGGRHPLLPAAACVPNDTAAGGDNPPLHVLTGPNASGKSVYMKQVGLIVYLAHIGSFVPAAAAAVGLVRRVRSRLRAAECVAAHMSAFLIDLRQMSLALAESSADSLVLVDEFGKGTAEPDGVALLASCVNSLLVRGEQCPLVLLATHAQQLPEYIIRSPLVQFQTFEYMMQDGAPVFLYRLTEAGGAGGAGGAEGGAGGAGGAGSLAHEVAAASGVPAPVVRRAADVMRALRNNTLPPPNERAVSKMKAFIEMIKTDLFSDDV